MKLSPLRARERPQDRMIQQVAPTQALFAARDDIVHLPDLRHNLSQHVLDRQPRGRANGGASLPGGR
ncbi:MAG TPA: hypothetical protein VMQ17_18615 [Candidatus Sulfotelmatobacter sp.]|nr:hypothetical protein [Candidatus Sulfotelmatobacter sp.]